MIKTCISVAAVGKAPEIVKGFINKYGSSKDVPNSTSAGFYNIYFKFDIHIKNI